MALDERFRETEDTPGWWLSHYEPPEQVLIRLDGVNFRRLTHKLKKPYAPDFSAAMIVACQHLAKQCNAWVAHTHSDEMSFLLYNEDPKSEYFMGGKHEKIISVLASEACYWLMTLTKGMAKIGHPVFDCRAYRPMSWWEALDYFLWREWNAERNSVAGLAQRHFSHKELQGKNQHQMKKMLREQRHIVWEDHLPFHMRYGTFFVRGHTERRFSPDEIEKLPPKHEARTNPDLVVKRKTIWTIATRWKEISKALGEGQGDFSDKEKWPSPEHSLSQRDS